MELTSSQAQHRSDPPGLRERQKIDKLFRIKAAGRSVFISKGFEGATTREIALIADVSQATVFLYAKDKRDLLFLVFNDDLNQVMGEAVSAVKKPGPLVERLARWYTPFLRYFSTDVPIGLLTLHERSIVGKIDEPTPQSIGVRRRDDITLRELLGLIDAAVHSGEISDKIDVNLAVRVIRSIYFGELERWLVRRPHPSFTQGLRELRAALELVVSGLRTRA